MVESRNLKGLAGLEMVSTKMGSPGGKCCCACLGRRAWSAGLARALGRRINLRV